MRSPSRFVGERGAGTTTALGLIVAILGIAVIMLNLGNRVLNQQRLNLATDNAAVAAADALRGLVAGFPCEVAAQMVPVSKCTIVGNDVLIETESQSLTSRARAGE